jgi:hypothetical protein
MCGGMEKEPRALKALEFLDESEPTSTFTLVNSLVSRAHILGTRGDN